MKTTNLGGVLPLRYFKSLIITEIVNDDNLIIGMIKGDSRKDSR